MRKLSKEQWRKIHGIREPTDPADPSVMGRRVLHESIVQWEIKWLTRLHLISSALAFVVVLLPMINKSWYGFISAVPVVSWIQKEFSSLGGWAILTLVFGLVCYFYSASKIDGKSYSEYGYPINLSHIGSADDIMIGDLFPRTKLEEKVFLVDSAGGAWMATVWWFIVFGIISFFVKMGGN